MSMYTLLQRDAQIMVDDSLPSGSDGHLLCASTGKHGPTWPSIVEKAVRRIRLHWLPFR